MRRTTAGILLASLIVLLGGQAAHAEEVVPSPGPDYAPGVQVEPTLGGSTAVGVCDGDVPYILFAVKLTDPNGLVTTNVATMVLNGAGGQTMEIPLGTLQNGSLSGTVLWPGASVDENGEADGWPGWELVDGVWVETSGNFAWTRSVTSATISVNPSVTVPLSYPPATPGCTDPVGSTPTVVTTGEEPPSAGVATAGDSSTTGGTLSNTGVAAWTLPLGSAAVGAVLVGFALALMRRRSTRTE